MISLSDGGAREKGSPAKPSLKRKRVESVKSQAKKNYLHILIALVLGVVLKLIVPASNGLTEVGVSVIAVFVPVLYLWLTVGTDWPSWLCLALIFMTGVMTPAAVFSGTFGTGLIITVIGMMAFSKVLVDTGVIETVVKWAVTRRFVRNRPYVFIALVLVVCGVVSCVMDVGSVALIFISIIAAICNEIGYKKGDPFYTALIIGLFWVSNAFNGGSPLGHALPLIMMNAASAGGYEITYSQWMSVGIPAAVIISAVCILFICIIWRPEASKFCNYDIEAHRKEVKPLTKQGKITIILLLLVILYWILPTIFPGMLPEGIKAKYTAWGSNLPLIIAMVLLCVIHVDEKPIASFRDMTSTSTVTVLLFIGAVTVLGSAVSSADTGISVCLANLLAPVTSKMGVFMIVALSTLGCIILTNFISNTVCMLLFFSLSVPLVAAAGVPTLGVIIVLCVAACFASLVPSAAVTAPFFFGPGHITVKNTAKVNIIMILVTWAILSFVIYPLSGVILG